MVSRIEIISKIIKIGTSFGIIIEKKYMMALKLKYKDHIKIIIEKIEGLDKNNEKEIIFIEKDLENDEKEIKK